MAESRWFTFAAGGRRWAVPAHEVWLIAPALPVNPLPGAHAWCGGWVILRDTLVPVHGGAPFSGPRDFQVLLVLRKGSSLLGLPCDGADVGEGHLAPPGPGDSPAPSAGILEVEGGEGLPVLDVERLYRGLGLPIESAEEDRG